MRRLPRIQRSWRDPCAGLVVRGEQSESPVDYRLLEEPANVEANTSVPHAAIQHSRSGRCGTCGLPGYGMPKPRCETAWPWASRCGSRAGCCWQGIIGGQVYLPGMPHDRLERGLCRAKLKQRRQLVECSVDQAVAPKSSVACSRRD